MPDMADAHRDRRKLMTLVLCCTAQFMVILDVSIVNVALPAIRGDLHFSPTDLQWVVNAYALTFAGFLLLGGRAADLLGRRRVFVSGLVLFTAASMAGGLAPTQGLLVAARAVQGVGGAVVAPATLAILTTTFTEGAERNRALGAWGAMGGAGGAAGALLGGILTQGLNWRWILFINIPIGLTAALAAHRLVAEGRREEAAERHFDLAGALTVTTGLVALVYAIVGSTTYGWTSARTLAFLGLGIILLGVFVFVEGRVASAPLVPLRIFASRLLTGANVVIFALGCSAFAMWYFVSLYLQEVLGFTPIATGLAFLPMTLMIVACSTVAGRIAIRAGAGRLMAGGMGLIAIGMLLFARVAVDGSYLGDVLIPSLLTAAGIGLTFVPVTIAAVSGVAPSDSGVASGLINTSRQMGGALGLAILATVASDRTAQLSTHAATRAALTAGFQRAFLVGAAFALAGVLASILLVIRRPRSADPRSGAARESATAAV